MDNSLKEETISLLREIREEGLDNYSYSAECIGALGDNIALQNDIGDEMAERINELILKLEKE